MPSIEQFLEAREKRRFAAEHRYLERQERLEKKAEPMVGELCREGKTVYYCWPPGGKYFEAATEHEVQRYLIRNRWVSVH